MATFQRQRKQRERSVGLRSIRFEFNAFLRFRSIEILPFLFLVRALRATHESESEKTEFAYMYVYISMHGFSSSPLLLLHEYYRSLFRNTTLYSRASLSFDSSREEK
jgi:hypothetical protein